MKTNFLSNVMAVLAVCGVVHSSSASAQLLGQYGGDNLELTGQQGGNLGSVTMHDMPQRWKTYKEIAGFTRNNDEKKGSVTIVTDPKRLEIDALLQSSFDLVKEKKYDEALLKLQQLDAIEGKTPGEVFYVQRARVSIASATGNEPLLIKSLEGSVESGQATPEEQLGFERELSNLYAKQKDIPRTIAWTSRYLKDGGNEPGMHTRLIRAYYLNGEYAVAARELRIDIAADEAAARKPARQDIRLLISAEFKANNHAGFNDAIEKSLAYYPKKEDWAELLNNVLAKPEFDEDLGLDVYRLMFKTDQFTTASDYMNMAQLTLQLGFPAEAKQVLTQGFKSGVLGKGAGAAAQKQLLNVANSRLAAKSKSLAAEEAQVKREKDAGALANVGYKYVTDGDYDKGIELLRQAIAMGGMKSPEHAKPHLGMALGAAGRNKEAIQTLRDVKGNDGAAELARYWAIQLAQPHA